MYSTDAPTSPEQFLREFQQALADAKNIAEWEGIIKGYSKLLKLREDAARVDALQWLIQEPPIFERTLHTNLIGLQSLVAKRKTHGMVWNDGMREAHNRVRQRIQELTTPNNTTNSPEEGKQL